MKYEYVYVNEICIYIWYLYQYINIINRYIHICYKYTWCNLFILKEYEMVSMNVPQKLYTHGRSCEHLAVSRFTSIMIFSLTRNFPALKTKNWRSQQESSMGMVYLHEFNYPFFMIHLGQTYLTWMICKKCFRINAKGDTESLYTSHKKSISQIDNWLLAKLRSPAKGFTFSELHLKGLFGYKRRFQRFAKDSPPKLPPKTHFFVQTTCEVKFEMIDGTFIAIWHRRPCR